MYILCKLISPPSVSRFPLLAFAQSSRAAKRHSKPVLQPVHVIHGYRRSNLNLKRPLPYAPPVVVYSCALLRSHIPRSDPRQSSSRPLTKAIDRPSQAVQYKDHICDTHSLPAARLDYCADVFQDLFIVISISLATHSGEVELTSVKRILNTDRVSS